MITGSAHLARRRSGASEPGLWQDSVTYFVRHRSMCWRPIAAPARLHACRQGYAARVVAFWWASSGRVVVLRERLLPTALLVRLAVDLPRPAVPLFRGRAPERRAPRAQVRPALAPLLGLCPQRPRSAALGAARAVVTAHLVRTAGALARALLVLARLPRGLWRQRPLAVHPLLALVKRGVQRQREVALVGAQRKAVARHWRHVRARTQGAAGL
mmetsp:Transcript_19002/g.59151  ORF Transcript_19002/g.59151 Transcript_19002/m.59151 type:complete len:214 (-) Transcript_19002:78-719(-)